MKQANQLWRDHRAGKVDGEAYRQQGQEIEDQLTHQLRHRQLSGVICTCKIARSRGS